MFLSRKFNHNNSFPSGGPNLDRLKEECEEIRTLIPKQVSVSSEDGHPSAEATPSCTPTHKASGPGATNGTLHLEDLDLLPTKEDAGQEHTPGRLVWMQETDFYWGRLIYEYICENVACELECRCNKKKRKDIFYMNI